MAREKEIVIFIVDGNQDLIRIDKFLFDKMPNVTRNKIKEGIKLGKVLVNKNSVKPSYKIKPKDEVEVKLDREKREEEIKPENIQLDIIHEDEDVLIVNKKAGMVVHPAHENWDGTLVNALIYHLNGLPEMKGNKGRPGLVHRIDKDTSGLLVIAKNEKSMTSLADQFFKHTIKRKYQTIVWGTPTNNQGTIDVNLRRSIKDRRVVEGFANNTLGKRAITHYKLIEKIHYISLIECKLETGRTHQIRAHMKHIGHPIFCDKAYGGKLIVKGNKFTNYKRFVENSFKIIERQALHAKSRGFIHPSTKKEVYFESKLPDDMSLLLEKWRKYEVPKSY